MLEFQAKIAAAFGSEYVAGARDAKDISRICIFDFDSTLFRSPLPNPNLWTPEVLGTLISDCGWFSEKRTLHPPCVPKSPNTSWWDTDVVAEVRNASLDPSNLVILLTGRRNDVFSSRIAEIVESYDADDPLRFDFQFLREGQDQESSNYLPTTLDFKFAVIFALLDALPMARHISLWDDRRRHVELFTREFEALRQEGRLDSFLNHHIIQDPQVEKRMPRDCELSLVEDLVTRCNARIVAAREREELRALDHSDQTRVPTSRWLRGKNCGATDLAPLGKTRSSPSINFSASPTSAISTDILSAKAITATSPRPVEEMSQSLSVSLQDISSSSALSQTSPPPLHSPSSLKSKKSLGIRRGSASIFRSIIELTEVTYFTAVFLDGSSRTDLLSRFVIPPKWTVRGDHVTICMGPATDELLRPLGGMNARIRMKVVAAGRIEGRVLAVKVQLLGNEDELVTDSTEVNMRLSTNAVPHVTIAFSHACNAKESNDITSWMQWEDEPLILSGFVGEKRLMGLKGKNNPIPGNLKPKEVSIGDLILKHHPTLKGRAIRKAKEAVESWMSKTFIDNLSHNAAAIELFIANLNVDDLV